MLLRQVQAELVRRNPRDFTSFAKGQLKSREAVELATLTWVSWFNHHRLMEPLGYLPPAEYEANYYRQQTAQAVPQT